MKLEHKFSRTILLLITIRFSDKVTIFNVIRDTITKLYITKYRNVSCELSHKNLLIITFSSLTCKVMHKRDVEIRCNYFCV